MNIVEALNKLQSIDVKDLKNIDLGSVQENLKGKPDILIIIGLIVVSLSATIYLYVDSRKQIQKLDAEQVVLDEVKEAADLNKTLESKLEAFKTDFPEQIVVDDLIHQLSGFAIDHDVKIISFSPAQEQKADYSTISRVQINILAKDYAQMIDFLGDIEKAPYAIRIENFSAQLVTRTQKRSRRSRQPVVESASEQVPTISANIKIAAIKLEEK